MSQTHLITVSKTNNLISVCLPRSLNEWFAVALQTMFHLKHLKETMHDCMT